MDFRTFFFDLPPADRDVFAKRAGTSRGLLTQVAYQNKRVELGLADVVVKLANGAVGLNDMPLTDNAKRQRAIREGAPEAPEPARVGG